MSNTRVNECMKILVWMLLVSMPAGGNGMQLAPTHKGVVALAVRSNTSSSSSTTSGTCTCEFTADNDVDLVYVQESSMSYSNGADWQAISTLTFACDSHTLLAVKAFDSDAGCEGGGFAMKCTSTDPASPWHYLAADQSWKAYGSTCTDGQNTWPCPSSAEGDTAMYTSTPGGWYNQVFDDSAWGAADVAGPWVADKLGTPISICDSAGAGWLFRSPYLAASWFVLQFAPPSGTGFCVSAAGRCGTQGCDGHAMSDLQLLNCDPSDPYQLFKFEAGRLVSAAEGYRCVKTSSPAYDHNCAPYTLAACDWTDTDQEFEKLTFEGATVWKASGRYMDAKGGNAVLNEVWACLGGPNWVQKFEPMVAQEYAITRRSRPDPARSVCGDLGSLAMPKTDAERDALTQDLATYSGLPGYAFLAGKYLNNKWVWDDGTDIDIKGSDFLNNGANEPYLCISTSGSDIGAFHDCGDQWYPAVCDTGNAYSVPTESPTLSPTASPTTSSPTASPTMSPAVEVTALGDPHIKNVQGHFSCSDCLAMSNTRVNECMKMLVWMLLVSMPAGGNGMQLAPTHKGAVDLTARSNTSSSSSTTSGTCTCEFTADNDVDLVYVQESSMSYSNGADWQAISTLTFACDSHTLLAVKAFDSDAGCEGGGFAMKCTSTDPASPWHYLAADQSWKAYGSTCTDGQNTWPCPSSAEGDTAMYTSTPGGWYNQVFDDSAWGAADVAGPWVADKVGTPISICDSAGAGWLFRSPYLAASWFVLQFAPPSGTGFCVSAAGRCGTQGCDGHAMSDLQLLNCDPSDPYQLFKFEAGRLVSAAEGYRCVKTSSPAYDHNCAPYTLAACDWTDTDQEFEKVTFEGATVWKASSRYMDAKGGNAVLNEVWACLGGPNWVQKFEPMVAQEYVLTRRSRPDPARSVCGDLGSLAMPKTDAERDALTQDLATYSGLPGYAFLAGKYLNSKWVWDDGTDIDIKGSDFLNNGANEPYLCISTSGSDIGAFHDCGDQWYPAVCDTGNPYSVRTESPTLSPTVSPTTASPTMSPAVEVTALGDPHIKNIQGQRFDLHQPGDYVLVQIPKSEKVGMLVEHPLLRIEAHAKQVGGACGPLYLDAVRFRGMWASSGSKNGHGLYVEVDKSKAVVSHPQHKQRFLFGPGVRAVLSHALTDTGVAYINLRVSDLSKAGVPIGGLLGEEDQGVPANAPSDCREQASLLSLEHDAV